MSVVASLPTQQIERRPINIATIDGQLVYVLDVDTKHGVNRTIGQGAIRLVRPAYTDTELRLRWLNKPIEIQTGYAETGGARRIFSGRVAELDRNWGANGTEVMLRCKGWASILDFPSEEDVVFSGDTQLYEVIRSLCEMRGVPQYGGELITLQDGVTPVTLGGVMDVDEGKVIVPKRSSWLQWIERTCRLVGYRAFDRPDGFFWWQRVSGSPAADPVMAFAQASNVLSIGRTDSVDGIITWNDVLGARYEDADGIQIQVRSFPVAVPPFPYDPPPAFVRQEIRSEILVNQMLADAARAAAEADRAGPNEQDRWSFLGENTAQPGDVVALTASALELANAKRYVMTVDHKSGPRGFRTSWTGWAGSGTPIPGGDDIVEIPVITGPVHVGDEYLWHYAHPNPQGKEISFEIDVPDTFTALWVEGWIHGSNSFLLGGVNTESDVSKIEAWQGDGDRPVGSADLPVKDEELAKRLPYNQLPTVGAPKHWGPRKFRLPIPGRFEEGKLKVTFRSGEDRRIGAAFRFDDYEIYGVIAYFSGRGYPSLPGGGS